MAPLEEFQLIVTVVLPIVGPGLLVLPGLVPVGVEGTDTPPGVWKYSGVVYDEQPAPLHAATFHRYRPPALRFAV